MKINLIIEFNLVAQINYLILVLKGGLTIIPLCKRDLSNVRFKYVHTYIDQASLS